jgi:NitT/TauT family transport system substrate-binding protein
MKVLRIALALLALLGPLPVRAQSAPPTHVIVAALSSTDSASLHYAYEQGYFTKAGLDVELLPFTNGAAAVAALAGGAVHIAYANILSVAQAHVRGVPILLLAPGGNYLSRASVASLMTIDNPQLRGPRDLEGKTVGVVSLEGMMGIALQGWMEKNGGDYSKIRFTEIPPGAMIGALQTKRVDAVATFEPFQTAILAAGGRIIGKPYDSVAADFMVTCYCTTAAWASEHHAAAIKFAQAINLASPYVNRHYDELIPMISAFSKIPVETLAKLPPPSISPSLSRANVQPVIDAAAKYHLIPASFPARDIFVPGAP